MTTAGAIRAGRALVKIGTNFQAMKQAQTRAAEAMRRQLRKLSEGPTTPPDGSGSTAAIVATLPNIHRDPKKTPDAFRPIDFHPLRKPTEPTAAELAANWQIFEQITRQQAAASQTPKPDLETPPT